MVEIDHLATARTYVVASIDHQILDLAPAAQVTAEPVKTQRKTLMLFVFVSMSIRFQAHLDRFQWIWVSFDGVVPGLGGVGWIPVKILGLGNVRARPWDCGIRGPGVSQLEGI